MCVCVCSVQLRTHPGPLCFAIAERLPDDHEPIPHVRAGVLLVERRRAPLVAARVQRRDRVLGLQGTGAHLVHLGEGKSGFGGRGKGQPRCRRLMEYH